jgi:arylsulfatase A-like enzyme
VDFITKIGRLDLPLEDIYDYRLGGKCAEAIKQATNPFMLTCSFNWPHDPNVAPALYYNMVDKSKIKCSASLPCEERFLPELSKEIAALAGDEFLKEFIKIYYANTMMIDDQIGRIIDTLKASGKYDNTIIVFTADHGGHGMFWKSTSAFYEEVARVPLIISAPGCKKSARYNHPVELVDIMPTVLEMCGYDVPDNIDGASLVPALHGKKTAKDIAFSERLGINREHTRYPHTDDDTYSFMLRHEAFKYIIYKNDKSTEKFLYDLSKDPAEYVNLANNTGYAAQLEQMEKLLKQRLMSTGYTGELAFERKST